MVEVEGKEGARRENRPASTFGQGLDALGDANRAKLDELDIKPKVVDEKPENDVREEVQEEGDKSDGGQEKEQPQEDVTPKEDTTQNLEEDPASKEEKVSLDDDLGIPDIDNDLSTADTVEDDDEPKPKAETDDKKTEELLADPHLPEKTRERIEHFRQRVKELEDKLKGADPAAKQKVQELEAKVKELESAPKADPIAEEERQELLQLRRRFALEKDEEFNKQYEQPISRANDYLLGVVDDTLTEAQAKQIKALGFRKFAEEYPAAFKQFIEVLEENAPAQATMVRSKYAELVNLEENRKAKVSELTSEADKWFEEQQQKNQQVQTQHAERVKQTREQFANWAQSLKTTDPAFALEDTSKLEGEAKAQAEIRNQKKQTYQKVIDAIMSASKPEDYQKVVYRAAILNPTIDKLKAAVAENKTLKEKLAKIEKARDTRRQPQAKATSESSQEVRRPQTFQEQLDAMVKGNG